MKSLLALSAVAALLAISTPARAGDPACAVVTDAASCGWDLGSDPFCCEECCCCGPYGYISAIGGVSFMIGDSGGLNTLGPHPNTNDTSDEVFVGGGAVGLAIPRALGTLRVELEGRGRNEFRGETDSFQPPDPTFFYDVEADDCWSVMSNAWFDLPMNDRLDVYAGGGLGAGGYNLTVDDTVVTGTDSVSNFAWQVGTGVNYRLNDRLVLDMGYRYLDLGEADIELTDAFGASAGNYTFDVTAHELLFQLRLEEPFAFLRR
jgi:opacity protein-like surface antigen